MPERPRSHRLESESEHAFSAALGGRFLFRREVPDYGVDGGIEAFDETDHATGLRYFVQLKATDAEDPAAAKRVRIAIETADYYDALPLPLLMVRYISDGARLYARWWHGRAGPDDAPPAEEAKTIVFRWRDQDLVEPDSPARWAREARGFLALRSSALSFPVSFAVGDLDESMNTTEAELVISLRARGRNRRDVIDLSGCDEPVGLFVVNQGRLEVHLSGQVAASFQLPGGYYPGHANEALATDLMIVAALAFARWGQTDAAGRLTASYYSASTLVENPQSGWLLSAAMARSRHVAEALRLADELDRDHFDPNLDPGGAFTLVALHNSASLNDTEVDTYRDVIARRIQRRAQVDRSAAAREYVTLGNSYRTRAEPAKAIECYELALEADPGYADRHHYWRELGGVLFGAHRYAKASEAYGRAVVLHPDAEVELLRADALLFAGDYQRAQRAIADGLGGEPTLDFASEWILKGQLLGALVEGLGLDHQDRKSAEADRLAGEAGKQKRPEETERALLEALRMDGLSGLAWWNLAHNYSIRGADRDAGMLFLYAALCSEWDRQAWANAFLLLWNVGESPELEFLPLILITGERMTGGNLVQHLVGATASGMAARDRQKFVSMLTRILDEFSDPQDETFELRLIQPDGAVESIALPTAIAGGAAKGRALE